MGRGGDYFADPFKNTLLSDLSWSGGLRNLELHSSASTMNYSLWDNLQQDNLLYGTVLSVTRVRKAQFIQPTSPAAVSRL